ncbi:hypothetical protein ACCI51_07470 [Microbulbifer echini]|uniref:Uncharacterized protein n=1 Tax=Microbulbifer echini TaxID=1529067 RepID=A0ABV4NLE4_9GAMM|nr:hypothetical protein [uncultured Microbulbifer sp.]
MALSEPEHGYSSSYEVNLVVISVDLIHLSGRFNPIDTIDQDEQDAKR